MLPLGLGLILWFDGRSRLFFKIDIPRDKLQKLWELYMNNPVARAGYLLSFLSLVLGPVALLSVPLCIVGLRRVDPASHPPQGRRGQAITGLVLSAVGLAVFVALVVTLRA